MRKSILLYLVISLLFHGALYAQVLHDNPDLSNEQILDENVGKTFKTDHPTALPKVSIISSNTHGKIISTDAKDKRRWDKSVNEQRLEFSNSDTPIPLNSSITDSLSETSSEKTYSTTFPNQLYNG